MPLFGKKDKEKKAERPQAAVSQNETSYFGKNLMIKGRISGNGNVIILGGLDGEFDLRGRVKVAQSAKIKGEVKADIISVNGSVQYTWIRLLELKGRSIPLNYPYLKGPLLMAKLG